MKKLLVGLGIATIIILAFVFNLVSWVDIASFAAAGKKYQGYILTLDGEKQAGVIRVKNPIIDQVKIVFINEKDKRKTYRPKDIQGYSYEHMGENEFGETTTMWRHYQSQKATEPPKAFASTRVFMEVMEEGKLTLFDYYVERPANIRNPYKRFFYIQKEGEPTLLQLNQKNYRKIIRELFADHTALATKVGQVNHRFRHLWKMVRSYNQWAEQEQLTENQVDERFPF